MSCQGFLDVTVFAWALGFWILIFKFYQILRELFSVVDYSFCGNRTWTNLTAWISLNIGVTKIGKVFTRELSTVLKLLTVWQRS